MKVYTLPIIDIKIITIITQIGTLVYTKHNYRAWPWSISTQVCITHRCTFSFGCTYLFIIVSIWWIHRLTESFYYLNMNLTIVLEVGTQHTLNGVFHKSRTGTKSFYLQILHKAYRVIHCFTGSAKKNQLPLISPVYD